MEGGASKGVPDIRVRPGGQDFLYHFHIPLIGGVDNCLGGIGLFLGEKAVKAGKKQENNR
jgi:hypothetical protein